MTKPKLQYQFFALTFPTEFSVEQALDFFDSVSTALSRGSALKVPEHLVIELWSDKHGLKHRIGIPWQRAKYLVNQLQSHIVGIHIEPHERENFPDWTHVVEVGVSDNTRPFNLGRVDARVKTILSAAGSDPRGDDTVVIQWVIAPANNIRPPKESKPPTTSSWAVSTFLGGRKADREEIAERRANLEQNQFRAVLRVAAFSSSEAHAKARVKNIRDAYRVPETASIHFTHQWWVTQSAGKERLNRGAGPGLPYNFINATEIATFCAWPIGGPAIGGLRLGRTQYLPPNQTIPKNGRRLGLSYEDRPIAISPEDGCRHMFVLGSSGVGKTTLLANSLQQDIEHGFGAVVIESKGDLFHAALNAVPYERVNDVVVIDMTDSEWPVGFNVLQGVHRVKAIDDLTSLLSEGSSNDVYFSDIMYHALNTLCQFKELTLADLIPFLMPRTPPEKAWRDGIINRLPKNSEFYHYWKDFDRLKESERRQRVAPVLNRFMKFNNRRDVRNMLGQSESTIDLKALMRDNKLLFIYIPDSIGEKTVSLLTSLLFKEMWDAVRAVKDEKTQPTYLYLDEVHKLKGYINLAEVMSLARSFKYGLVMATQYSNQLSGDLQSAITSNAATMVSFKLDGPEARWMQSLMGKPVRVDDFMTLESYEAIGRIAMGGSSSSPTWFKTLAPFEPHNRAEQVRAKSRKAYSRPAEQVDREIQKRRSAPAETKRPRPTFGDVLEGDDA